jgi:hypothetical protein
VWLVLVEVEVLVPQMISDLKGTKGKICKKGWPGRCGSVPPIAHFSDSVTHRRTRPQSGLCSANQDTRKGRTFLK